jgi:hypothetical protein
MPSAISGSACAILHGSNRIGEWRGGERGPIGPRAQPLVEGDGRAANIGELSRQLSHRRGSSPGPIPEADATRRACACARGYVSAVVARPRPCLECLAFESRIEQLFAGYACVPAFSHVGVWLLVLSTLADLRLTGPRRLAPSLEKRFSVGRQCLLGLAIG